MATIPHVFASATSPIPLSQLDDNFTALNAAKAELTASTTPLMDGTAAIGSATTAAKADHVHPTDTTRATVAQATSAVAITGGSINSTPIGATTPSTGAFTTLTASGSISSSGAITTTSGGAVISAASGYAILGATTVGSYAPTGAVYVSGTTLTHNCGTSGYGWNNSANSAQLMTLGGAGNLAVTGNISSTGRTLVGTTTDDGVNALQVNGAAKATSIKFANTGGTKQALDYYEEGTWTPVLSATGSTFNPLVSAGTYTRIGNRVFFTCAVILNTTGNTLAANTLRINGLPFTTLNSTYAGGTVSVMWSAFATTLVALSAQPTANTAYMQLYKATVATGDASVSLLATDLSATGGSGVQFQGHYAVN